MLFLGIISWEGASHFNRGASFLSSGVPHGEALVLMGGVSKKIVDGGGAPMPPPPPTMGNHETPTYILQ